jgi:hypothetical protein
MRVRTSSRITNRHLNQSLVFGPFYADEACRKTFVFLRGLP